MFLIGKITKKTKVIGLGILTTFVVIVSSVASVAPIASSTIFSTIASPAVPTTTPTISATTTPSITLMTTPSPTTIPSTTTTTPSATPTFTPSTVPTTTQITTTTTTKTTTSTTTQITTTTTTKTTTSTTTPITTSSTTPTTTPITISTTTKITTTIPTTIQLTSPTTTLSTTTTSTTTPLTSTIITTTTTPTTIPSTTPSTTKSTTPSITQSANTSTETSTGTLGDEIFCTSGIPCGEDKGDCDSNDECQTGLVCGLDNCPSSHGFDSEIDCCRKPIACIELHPHASYINGTCYIFSDNTFTFSDAKIFCMNNGAIIAEPKNEGINTMLYAIAMTKWNGRYWLGIQKYNSSTDIMIWESDGSHVLWTNWHSGQPNHDGDCVYVFISSNHIGLVYDSKFLELLEVHTRIIS